MLVLAPQVGLPNAAREVQRIANSGLRAHIEQSDVTVDSALQLIAQPHWRVMFFVTHGKSNYLLMEDGHLAVGVFASHMSENTATGLIYLSACKTVHVAQLLLDSCAADIICTIGEIDDADAAATSARFAEKLAETGDFRVAYEKSRPRGESEYIYLTNGRQYMAYSPMNNRSGIPDEIWQKVMRNVSVPPVVAKRM